MSWKDGLQEEYDFVVVGAGLSGFVMAEQAATRFGLKSLIIDKRDHIGEKASPVSAARPNLVPAPCIAD